MNVFLKQFSFIVLSSLVSLSLIVTDSRATEGSFEVFVDDVYIAGGVLVDDFSGTTVDFSKWTTDNEYAAKLDTDNGNLVMISAGSSKNLPFNSTRTFLVSPDLTSIQSSIIIVDTAAAATDSVSASVAGQYYNANSAMPSDQNGDVMAVVSIGDRGNGNLEAWATILESTDSNFTSSNSTNYDIITAPGVLLPNTAYTARIQYNQVTDVFTFTVAGVSILQMGPPRVGPANLTQQFLYVSSCCDSDALIHAAFDDLTLGGALVDDFSGNYLDRNIWDSYSRSLTLASRLYPTIPGKLLMFTSNEDIPTTGRADSAIFLQNSDPGRFEARVSVSSNSSLEPGARGRIRLNGYSYNERRDGGVTALPYDVCDDEVWVQVQINLLNGELWASADSQVETVDCDTKRTLISERFSQAIAFDTEYLLWFERVGNTLTLGLDTETFSHTIDTPIYQANFGGAKLSNRIQEGSLPDDNDDGGSGGGGSCFIATAAYGSYLDPQVQVLRDFRDQQLLSNRFGIAFVELYYQYSPPIADYIREREALRAIVRSGLSILIYAIKNPVSFFAYLLLIVLLFIALKRRRSSLL